MKNIFKIIITFILIMAIFYLIWSFYNISIDFTKWNPENRFMYLLMSVPFSLFISLFEPTMKYLNNSKKY